MEYRFELLKISRYDYEYEYEYDSDYDYDYEVGMPTCLKCGWSWKQRKAKRPVECPDCKSRYWDEADVQGEQGKVTPTQEWVNENVRAGEAHMETEPSLGDLRKIASGEMGFSRGEVGKYAGMIAPVAGVKFEPEWPGQVITYDDREIATPCPYKEMDRDTGEWVYCALAVHSPKVKHVPGKRESV